MLVPAAQASIDAHDQARRDRWNGERPLFDTAFTIGDAALATPGCEAWPNPERRARVGDSEEPEPAGGIILEITSVPVPAVTDDGEIVQRRAYRCYDYSPGLPDHRRIVVLTEDQVAGFDAMDISRVRALSRHLRRKGRTRGPQTRDELDTLRDALLLASLVEGQR